MQKKNIQLLMQKKNIQLLTQKKKTRDSFIRFQTPRW